MNLLFSNHPDRQALDKIQSTIAKLHIEMEALAAAPLPLAEVRQTLHDQLEANAGSKPDAFFFGFTYNGGDRRIPDLLSFNALVFLFGADVLTGMVMRRLEAIGGKYGLPANERAAAIDDLNDKLEVAECSEETEIMRLEEAGYAVIRRADARPDLVLDLWKESP